MYFCIKSSVGTQGEVSRKSALNPAVVYSTNRYKVVVPVLVLLFVALYFILRGNFFFCFKSCLVLFCSCIFQSF